MNKKCFVLVFVVVFVFGFICGEHGMSYAQEANTGEFTLEEITVTAEKREANLQDTPLSVTAVTGDLINQIGAFNADEVLKNVPNVVVQRAARGYVVAIRGLGSDLPPGQGDSSVSTNFDGVYNYAAESGTLGYYDLERVEVLRGPQGTLYGRNATAGVVNVISREPSDILEGYGTIEMGNYSLLRMEGAVNVPLNDNFSARTTFVSINRDGFLSNGDDDAVGSSGRIKLRYKPNDNLKVVFSSEYTKLGGHGPGGSKDGFIAAYEVENNQISYKSYKFNANVEFTAGPGVFTFIPSYAYQDGTVIGWDGRSNSFQKSWDPMDTVTKSAELRYASKSDSEIKWIGGLYYYDNVVCIL
jgi:iron complex outermembrane recepter protein